MRTSATLALSLLLCTTHAQWVWTQTLQSSSDQPESGFATRFCPDNGTVATGQWRNEARFGNLTFTAPVQNQMNGFVVRYDAAGTAQWGHVFRSTASDRSVFTYGLAVDTDGSIIVGGHAPDSLLMDGTMLTFDEGGAGNISAWFIAKFSADGALLWAVDKEMTTNGAELWDLAVDPAGNIWACGMTSGSNSRFMKFSGSDGALLFESTNIPGRVARVGTTADGHVLVTGISASSFQLGPLNCPYNNSMGGSSTTWTVKADAAGTALWHYAPDQGSSGYPMWGSLSMAATADGRSYVIARPKTRIAGDTIALSSYNNGLYMLDADGVPVWWKPLNTTGIVSVHDVGTAPDGSCWVVGDMSGNSDIADTIINHTGLFAIHFDDTGNVLHRVFGPQVVDTYSVDARDTEIMIGGTQAGTMAFGEHVVTDNWFGLFVARYGVADDVGLTERPAGIGITAYPNPARDLLRLHGVAQAPVHIDVLNAVGQSMLRIDRFNLNADVIDLSDLPGGMLMINITSTNARATVRVAHQP